MKKFVSLLLAALLLATMLTVFAVPASARGRDNYVGKWVNIDNTGALGATNDIHAYCFAYGSASMGQYKIAIYKVGDNTIISKETIENAVVSEVSTSFIPQVVLAEAKKDYPELFSTGSTLSEGSLTIIVGIAAAVVFGLGGFFIGKAVGKKKKSAAEDNAEKDEE